MCFIKCVLFTVLYWLCFYGDMATWMLTQQVNRQEQKWTEINWIIIIIIIIIIIAFLETIYYLN
jgi:Na+/H+ antiporter NhaC